MPWNDVLSGFVWPPVEGRILLHEAAPLSGTRVSVTSTNDYFIGLGSGWRVHASARATFAELEHARAALIAWARKHTGATETLSKKRCLVVSEVTPGEWRLWQLVQHVPSLREQLSDEAGFDEATAQRTLETIAAACAALELPCTLETVGIDPATATPVFVGLVPPPADGVAA